MNKRAVLEKILVTVLGALAVLGLSKLGMQCISLTLFGIRCPGCGITRALLAILRWDWQAAMAFNSGVLLLPLFYLYYWMDGRVFRDRRVNNGVLIVAGALFLLRYVVSLFW